MTKIATYRETANMAIELTFTVSFDGLHTSRTCLLRAVSVLLCTSPHKDSNDEAELKGWCLGECPLVLPFDKVGDDDVSGV